MDDEFDALELLEMLGNDEPERAVETEERGGSEETPEFIVSKVDMEAKEIELTPVEDPKAECLRQITNILGEYGLESNIPVHHLYWKLVNKYRVM